MSSVLAPPKLMDIEAFLAWPGDGTAYWHQLIDGEPVPMDAPSWTHGAILAEFAARLRNHFVAQNSPCRVVVGAGVQPRVGASINLRIPDLTKSELGFTKPAGPGLREISAHPAPGRAAIPAAAARR